MVHRIGGPVHRILHRFPSIVVFRQRLVPFLPRNHWDFTISRLPNGVNLPRFSTVVIYCETLSLVASVTPAPTIAASIA